jgi:hypothetical protein
MTVPFLRTLQIEHCQRVIGVVTIKATIEQLRQNQLRKQGLHEEYKADFSAVAKTQLGLHSTDYWTPYLSAWARIGEYDAEVVFKWLNSGKKILRMNAFRGALHVIHQSNYPLILQATSTFHCKRTRDVPPLRTYSDKKVDSILTKVIAALEGRPLRMKEIKQQVSDGKDVMRWILLMGMCEGKIVRSFANHAKNTQSAYALAEKWLERYSPPDIDVEDAVNEIIQKHIQHFGPVTVNDVSWWLPTTKTSVKSIIQELGEQVTSVEMDGQTYFMDADDLEIATSLESWSKPYVFFLPYEDHFAKSFIDRTWFISEESREILFPSDARNYWPPKCKPPEKIDPRVKQSGEKRPSIWVNGRIVGRWEFEDKKDNVKVAYKVLEKVSKKALSVIEEKRLQLEEFVRERLVPISKKGAVKDSPEYPR